MIGTHPLAGIEDSETLAPSISTAGMSRIVPINEIVAVTAIGSAFDIRLARIVYVPHTSTDANASALPSNGSRALASASVLATMITTPTPARTIPTTRHLDTRSCSQTNAMIATT